MIWQFNCFYRAVPSPAEGARAPTKIFRSLMMMAADPYDGLFGDPRNACPVFQQHFTKPRRLAIFGLIMLKGTWESIGYVVVERAAQAHVEQLATAAGAQKRLGVIHRLLKQHELKGTSCSTPLPAGQASSASRARRLNLSPTREHDSVDPRISNFPGVTRQVRTND
jgi:hypothetical protein